MRNRPMHGSGEDANKWHYCRVCGFPCNMDRDALGDQGQETIDVQSSVIAGSTAYFPVVTSGCPFCGSRNWK